jgi:hypothetical protein
MKRLLEHDDIDCIEPPCALPGETWEGEILPRETNFLTRRALRMTCSWFARHVIVRGTCHDYFWPAVEDYARRGYTHALRTLDWPTHPRVLLSGYEGPNVSYYRAGLKLVKSGDLEILMIMVHRYGEYWTKWISEAAERGRVDIIEALYNSTAKEREDFQFGYYDTPFVCALRNNQLETMRILCRYNKMMIKRRYISGAIHDRRPLAILHFLGVTLGDLRESAHAAIIWFNFARAEFILDTYVHDFNLRAKRTRFERMCALVGKEFLQRWMKEFPSCHEWATQLV